jgi:hypothetical protein
MQRRRSAIHGDGVPGAAIIGERGLEPRDGRTLGQPVGPQHRYHGINILGADVLPAVRNARHGSNPTHCGAICLDPCPECLDRHPLGICVRGVDETFGRVSV